MTDNNEGSNVVTCNFGRAGRSSVMLLRAFESHRDNKPIVSVLHEFKDFVDDQIHVISRDDLSTLLDIACYPVTHSQNNIQNETLEINRKESFALLSKYALKRTDLVDDQLMNRVLNAALNPCVVIPSLMMRALILQLKQKNVPLNKPNLLLVRQLAERDAAGCGNEDEDLVLYTVESPHTSTIGEAPNYLKEMLSRIHVAKPS